MYIHRVFSKAFKKCKRKRSGLSRICILLVMLQLSRMGLTFQHFTQWHCNRLFKLCSAQWPNGIRGPCQLVKKFLAQIIVFSIVYPLQNRGQMHTQQCRWFKTVCEIAVTVTCQFVTSVCMQEYSCLGEIMPYMADCGKMHYTSSLRAHHEKSAQEP